MKRILYKEPHYTNSMILTVKRLVVDRIDNQIISYNDIDTLKCKSEETISIISRLIQVLVDKNLLTSDELFYIVKGIDKNNNDQIEIIEE